MLIAEIGVNHLGDEELLDNLVRSNYHGYRCNNIASKRANFIRDYGKVIILNYRMIYMNMLVH